MGDPMSFRAELQGLVNAGMIDLSGGGFIDLALGLTEATYHLHSLPKLFSPGLLSACLITGYPHASVAVDGSPNIFARHPYRYTRRLEFRGGGRLLLQTDCRYERGMLASTFQLEGDVSIADVGDVCPVIESWEPAGAGRIQGHFIISWHSPQGPPVSAEAFTDYEIASTDIQATRLHRLITITSAWTPDTLHKSQYSRLFHNSPPRPLPDQ